MSHDDQDLFDWIGARLEQSMPCPHCNGTGKHYYDDDGYRCELPGVLDECETCGGTTIWEFQPDMAQYRSRVAYRRVWDQNWHLFVN